MVGTRTRSTLLPRPPLSCVRPLRAQPTLWASSPPGIRSGFRSAILTSGDPGPHRGPGTSHHKLQEAAGGISHLPEQNVKAQVTQKPRVHLPEGQGRSGRQDRCLWGLYTCRAPGCDPSRLCPWAQWRGYMPQRGQCRCHRTTPGAEPLQPAASRKPCQEHARSPAATGSSPPQPRAAQSRRARQSPQALPTRSGWRAASTCCPDPGCSATPSSLREAL